MPASRYQYAYLAVDALLGAYEPLLDLCKRMETVRMPEKPRSIIIIQMRCPVINEFVFQQEVYSRNDEWEIRMRNDTSSTVLTKCRYNSLDDYKTSTEVTAMMAVAYILSPCVGYPINVSRSSTRTFAAWLSAYISAGRWDDSDLDHYTELLKEEYSGKNRERINGILVPEIPLTKEEENCIGEILERMHTGENFDEPFKALYHRLLQGERITASDIVTQLHNHQGD